MGRGTGIESKPKAFLVSKICTLPWNHLYVTNTGVIFPCCASHYTLGQAEKDGWNQYIENTDVLDNHSKTPNMKKLRQDLLDGKEPEVCRDCFKKENEGIWSYRNATNELFESTFEEVSDGVLDLDSPLKLEFLDLRLGNRCNLACRMCNASSSHMLLSELREFHNDSSFANEVENMDWFTNRHMYKNLVEHGENLKVINMAGGEPFIIDEAWEFLEMLIEKGYSKNIELRYNTNMTVVPEKAKKLWKEFKGVVLFLSIDGVGSTYEYIRYPAKFEKIRRNMLQLDSDFESYNIDTAKVLMTVQGYNVANIPEMVYFLQEFKRIDKVPIINILNHPDELAIGALPTEYQTFAGKKLKKFLMEVFEIEGLRELGTYENFLRNITFLADNLLNHDNFSKEKNERFNKITNFFDGKRGQKIDKILTMDS